MDVRTYFDRMAEHWDDEVTPIDEARRTIVFLSEIGEHTYWVLPVEQELCLKHMRKKDRNMLQLLIYLRRWQSRYCTKKLISER